jgi:hypothetical protein
VGRKYGETFPPSVQSIPAAAYAICDDTLWKVPTVHAPSGLVPISSVVSLASREDPEAIQAESGESFVLCPESGSRKRLDMLVFVHAHLLSKFPSWFRTNKNMSF